MPEKFSERMTQYIDNVVKKLKDLSSNNQDEKLQIVEKKCAEKADEQMTKQIMAAIRSKLAKTHHTTPSVITGLSITNTMINGPVAVAKKRPLLPASITDTKEKTVKKTKAAEDSVIGHLLSDGFIVDDVGEGTLIDEEIDDEDDGEGENDDDDESDEEIDPIFDHETYTNDKGKIAYAEMERVVREEVNKRRKIRAQTLLGGKLATHVLPDDDQAFHAIRAKHAQHQLNKTNAQIAELTDKMKASTKASEKEHLAARIAALKDDAAEQQSIIRRGGIAVATAA